MLMENCTSKSWNEPPHQHSFHFLETIAVLLCHCCNFCGQHKSVYESETKLQGKNRLSWVLQQVKDIELSVEILQICFECADLKVYFDRKRQ